VTDTFAFSRLDELFFHIDQPTDPFSLQAEVRVEGHFSSDRLRAAIAAAMAKHPLACVRQRPWNEQSEDYEWELAPDLAPPLKTVPCATEADIVAARDAHLALSVPLNEGPPFRALLLHHEQGDVLVLNVSHVASDGAGAARLLLSILRAYAGVDDPVPSVDVVAVRDVGRAVRPKSVAEGARRVAALGKYLLDSAEERPARIAGKFGEPGAGIGFEYLTLEGAELAQLEGARPPEATLNDLLAAALHITIARWNAKSGTPANRITMMMPMSLRPDALAQELVGNFSPWLNVATRAKEREDDFFTTLDTISRRTRLLKEQRRAGIITDLLELAHILPGWARRRLHLLMPLTGNFVVDSTVLYNLGRLPPLPEPVGRAGKVREVRFNPPARMPLGVSLGVVTAGERLFLSFRYRREQFDHVAAQDFVAMFRQVLADAARAP
jgi:NRPS condensation-like uncharacterized protein